MYWVFFLPIIAQAYTLLPQHLHVFGMGRPNWRRTCHPSFLRTILGIGSHYIFWSLAVWQLSCVFGLFLLTRAGGRGGCSCFDDFVLGRIVLGVEMVHQFQLVSWHLRRILGCMEIRLSLIEGYTCRPDEGMTTSLEAPSRRITRSMSRGKSFIPSPLSLFCITLV